MVKQQDQFDRRKEQNAITIFLYSALLYLPSCLRTILAARERIATLPIVCGTTRRLLAFGVNRLIGISP